MYCSLCCTLLSLRVAGRLWVGCHTCTRTTYMRAGRPSGSHTQEGPGWTAAPGGGPQGQRRCKLQRAQALAGSCCRDPWRVDGRARGGWRRGSSVARTVCRCCVALYSWPARALQCAVGGAPHTRWSVRPHPRQTMLDVVLGPVELLYSLRRAP